MYHDADEVSLHEKAREAIQRGTLPARRSDRAFGGPGSGALCALCHRAVMRQMTELELQFDSCDDIPRTDALKFHHTCFAAWVTERDKILGMSP
jgi:hypothetical protein